VTIGLVIFAATYLLIAVQRLPFVHLNRPAASLLGAVAMVVFGVITLPRAMHEWPPVLEVPMHWVKPFAELARDLDLPVRDAHEAIRRVRAFVERIRTA
jgi:hypothetical protein